MAETLLFSIPAPGAGEEAATTVRWYQSIDGAAWGTAVDSIAVADLPVDALAGKYVWASALADPAKYHQLKTESAGGVQSTFGAILPPRSADPAVCIIYAETKSLGLQPVAAEKMTIRIKTPKGVGGTVIDDASQTAVTDANGRVQIPIVQGVVVEIDFPPVKQTLTVDTTGKNLVNIADLLA